MNLTFSRAEVIYNAFEKKLTNAHRKELFYNLVRNLLIAFLSIIITGFLLVLLESVFHFRSSVRTVIFWLFSLSSLTTFTYFVLNYLLKRTGVINTPELLKIAGRTGKYFINIKDSIVNSLSLYNLTRKKEFKNLYYSENLILSNLEKIDSDTKDVDLSSFVNFKNLKKPFSLFLFSAFFIALSFTFFPNTLFSSLDRLINYRYSYIDNNFGIVFEISPGNYETFKGDKVNISIKIKSNKPDLKISEIEFYTKQYAPDGYEILSDSRDLKASAENTFYTSIDNISTDFVYYAEYKEIRSEEYKIRISDYPILKNLFVTITPPEYTGMPVRKLNENEGDIYCIEGSKITFDLKASKELSSAGIILNDVFLNLNVQGDGASGTILAEREGNYRVKLKDTKGNESKNEKTFSIRLLINEPPRIEIIEPQDDNFFIRGDKDILIKARIKDDYGFSKLNLYFRKSKSNSSASQNFSSVDVPIKNLNATEIEIPYVWDLKNLNVRSGDVIEYYMEVTDNSGKTAKSELRYLTYKSLSEILKKTEDITKNLEKDLKAIMEDIKKMNEDIQELKKNNTEELGVNDAQKRLDLQNKMENLQKNMDATQQKMEKGMNDLQQKNMLSEKTLDQFMKLQEMFNKINTPEFRDMMKKMLESLKKNDLNQLREEMKNYHFDEEAFKKQIEMLMKLMQKIDNLQKFGELTQKLDDITKNQEELKKLTENTKKEETGKLNTLSNRQQDIKEQAQDFKEQLKKLIDELNKMKEDINPNDLQKLSNKMDRKNIPEKMQKSSNELMKSQKENSEKTQEEILDDLKEMNEDMQNSLESAMDMQNINKKMMDNMEKIKNDLEKLSKEQQELKDKTDDIEKNDNEEFQKSRMKQSDLKNQLTGDINDLMEMTKDGVQVTPDLGKELGNAYNKMDRAVGNLSKREKADAMSNQGKAKESLDNASKMLGDMLDKMKQQGKTGMKGQGRLGQLMQQLAKIIAMQQALNGQIQKMGQNGKIGKDGKDGTEEMQNETKMQVERLKIQQEEIRKSLEQLNQEFEKEKERSGEKLLGDLKEVEKQMQESIRDMSDYNVDNRLIERQNRILSRMLDAQLAQREKDFEQKRESKPGEDVVRNSPPEVVINGPNSINTMKDDFLRLQKEGYTEDYEALIMKYLLELSK